MISILSKRQLVSQDLEVLDWNTVHNTLFIDDTDDIEYLFTHDYVWCEATKDDVKYIIIHGYPGDNASGVIIREAAPLEIISSVGECMDRNNMDEWQIWYTTSDLTI